MQKDFDHWNELKKKIDSEPDTPTKFPKKGEVWISSFGKNVGFEQNGSGDSFSRPVVILKKFNNHMFWSIPLSTKQKKLNFYFNYADPENQKVSAILAQLKLISVKRLRRKMYDMDTEIFNTMVIKLKSFL